MNHSRWINILTSPLSLALPLAIVIILLLPDIFDRYKLELALEERGHKPNSQEEYIDLDKDGYSERLVLFHNEIGIPAMKVLTNGGLTIDQWNFTGIYPDKATYHILGDANNDGIDEIYLFTLKSDSLLLNGINPFSGNDHFIKNRFITKIAVNRDTVHAYVQNGQVTDLTGHGKKVVLFAVEAGYSLQPRAIFIYDPLNDNLHQSSSYGVNFGILLINDGDSDGRTELMYACNTLGNIPDNLGIPYSDYSAYIMGFDEQLKLIFPPIEYDVYPSSAHIALINASPEMLYAYCFVNKSPNDKPSEIGIINSKGKVLKKRSIHKDDPQINGIFSLYPLPEPKYNAFLALKSEDEIIYLDENIEIIRSQKVPRSESFILRSDLNSDGKKEWIYRNGFSQLVIMDSDYNFPQVIETHYDSFSTSPLCVSVKLNGEDKPELFIKSNNKAYYYKYSQNFMYFLKIPTWFGIYLLLALLIFLIQYLQKVRMHRIRRLEENLNDLQLKNIKNQVDPHFTLNAINTISGMAIKGEKDKLMRFSSEYAGLMRKMLNSSDRIQTTLAEELEFNILYLELQRMRYNESFDFHIDIEDDVSQDVLLPRTLLHTYIENAVKHGVRTLEADGMINIRVWKEKGAVIIEVEDNGVGRKNSHNHDFNDGTGRGLEIIENIIALYEKLYNIQIITEFTDIEAKEGQVTGTSVRIVIPA